MAVSRDDVTHHRQKYGATYMINLFGSIVPILLAIAWADSKWESLATDVEVESYILGHTNSGMHPAGEQAIKRVELKSECRWLDDKITRLDDLIYQLQRDGADPDRIHDKEQDLENYEKKYDKRNCATVRY